MSYNRHPKRQKSSFWEERERESERERERERERGEREKREREERERASLMAPLAEFNITRS